MASDNTIVVSHTCQTQSHAQEQPCALPLHRMARIPPTLSAFTSRLGVPSPTPSERSVRDGRSSSSTNGDSGSQGSHKSANGSKSKDSHVSTSAPSAHSDTSRGTSISSSAISFDSDDEWEDDGQPLAGLEPEYDPACYDAHGNMVFKRIVPTFRPRPSALSQLLRQDQDTASSLSSSSSTPSCSSSPLAPDFNPLRCHPAHTPPPTPPETVTDASDRSKLPETPVASSPPSFSTPQIMHIPQVAGGLVFFHRSPRPLTDSTGPFTSMPFNGACGPRADPTVAVGPLGAAPREICCPGRLLPSELSRTLDQSILGENSSRYIFRQYGSRRRVESGTEWSPQVRRTQSAPNVQRVAQDASRDEGHHQTTMPMMTTEEAKVGVRDLHDVQFCKIQYVDDYVAPQSWSWGMDYHSKGW